MSDNFTPATLNPFVAVLSTPAGQALCRRVEAGGVLTCPGVSEPAQSFLAALLRHAFPKRALLVVTNGLKQQETVHAEIETWLRFREQISRAPEDRAKHTAPATDQASVYFYPAWETLPHESKLPHADVISERLETLVGLLGRTPVGSGSAQRDAEAPVVVANVTALVQRTFPPESIRARTRILQRGLRSDPLDLVEWLEDQGYEPEVQVNHRSEIALRGGILDIFPPTSRWPVRLEFFGDELESLRHFDPGSQLSKEPIESVTIPPAGELGLLQRMFSGTTEVDAKTGMAERNAPALGSLLDYLPADTLVLLCEPELLEEQAQRYAELVPAKDPFFVAWPDIETGMKQAGMTLISLGGSDDPPAGLEPETGTESTEPSLNCQSLDAFRPIAERIPELQIAEAQRRDFFTQLHRWLRQGYGVHLFCNNEGERQRFEEIWTECGLGGPDTGAAPAANETAAPPGAVSGSLVLRPTLHLGALARGFLCEPARLVIVTDAEVFGRYKIQRPRRLKSPHAQTSRSLLEIDFMDLAEGDYVVHLEHGIGRYLGLQALPVAEGSKRLEKAAPAPGGIQPAQECLVIEYAAQDDDQAPPKLYVPVSEAHLVSKYIGAGKARPALNTLGGGRWRKTKEHAARAVRDLAAELLAIQATRASQAGHAFKADSTWQREFESAFLYEETPDQWKAILATKADMEAARPMDRLICGDVGYGKTEVAIRAAFKAVMDGRQVAMLVPTTVLAQQHFNTFRERMADYPIRVELLSRFRAARDQRKVIQDLASGGVDIVIGTHRLIQNDIVFKDLGLVVIDEEQRFGVLHKEQFKVLRRLVDVLTLSATPIPRTLYLALTGARDMSTIETPPQDRLPVETIVCEYDERVIRDAILRELNRGGQVFYLHNRVFDIENVAQRLRLLLPRARIVVGHGQMGSDDLEEVMTRFVNGEADVLLSTTIIESGIDIPNANTIIIDRADRFGVSDLYQLRGRVGRYKHQAYAYLLVPRHARLLTDARKRISAIKQYSTLGSGFKIAMRDLEIRGAGNLLGPQQSGHIAAVGFELYCQLLKQSVAALKGEKVQPRLEVQVRLDFLALNLGEEEAPTERRRTRPRQKQQDEAFDISVPREVAVAAGPSGSKKTRSAKPDARDVARATAILPLRYIPDAHQRIDIYRKLAQITSEEEINRLKAELRDRFGPLPAAVELLLQLAEVRLLAAERSVTAIETQEEKLKITRNNDYLMIGGKFPRLTRKEPRARLDEIKRLLRALR